LLLGVGPIQTDIERRESLLAIEHQLLGIRELLGRWYLRVVEVDVVELGVIRVDTIADVVADELVLDLVVCRFVLDFPQQERADGVVAENRVEKADDLVGVPDELALDGREKDGFVEVLHGLTMLIDLFVITL